MDTPRIPGSGDLSAELQRLEQEIEELRNRLAQEAAADEARRAREVRARRLSRTSRADSHLIGSRALRVVSSTDDPAIAAVIERRPEPPPPEDDDDDDGPQAA